MHIMTSSFLVCCIKGTLQFSRIDECHDVLQIYFGIGRCNYKIMSKITLLFLSNTGSILDVVN